MIDISIEGGAYSMSEKLTIVPVTLDSVSSSSVQTSASQEQPQPSCIIRKSDLEVSFFPGVDEHIVQIIMKELKHQ